MPITTVVGGQYGSEGKGKVAHHLACDLSAAAVIRVGGPNAGHTSIDVHGKAHALQQLPVAALLDDVVCLIGPGSYVDPAILASEIDRFELDPARVCVDYRATVITEADRRAEAATGLGLKIGSTGSGTGEAVVRRVRRREQLGLGFEQLRPYVGDAVRVARDLLERGRRVVVEGTQGFGLSVLHSPHYPYATSRDTSAAAAVAEAGLSPLDVDDVTLVIRSYPIRVAGNSGPFDAEEVDWATVAREAGLAEPPLELTSVTRRVRRVARFDPEIVRGAIEVNRPTRIVMNHLDHVDALCAKGVLTERAASFVSGIARSIGRSIDLCGFGPAPEDLVACAVETPSMPADMHSMGLIDGRKR
jgi:adenylosuccinate synthase